MEPNEGNVKQRRNINFIDEGDTQCLLCSQCPFKTTKLRKLNFHIANKHAVVNLICDICDFKTGKRLEMNDHLKHTHEGFTYGCKKRPSKCLNHHNQRLCKNLLAGVNLLLQTDGV